MGNERIDALKTYLSKASLQEENEDKSEATIEDAKPVKEKDREAPTAKRDPEGKAIQFERREIKSAHVQVLMKPSTKAALQKIADEQKAASTNELINYILEKFIEDYKGR